MPFIWVLTGVILDQTSKWLALRLPSVYTVHNQGAAWGLFSHYTGILIIIGSLVSLYGLITLYNSDRPAWGLCLLIAGAIGNTLDRLYHGAVIDFIAIGPFPVFNLADSFISIGIFMMYYDTLAV